MQSAINIANLVTMGELHIRQRVRIVGDTFRNPYVIAALQIRTARNGHRLIGGDHVVIIRTWAGNDRRVSPLDLVDAESPWDDRDAAVAGRRVRARAARRHQFAANTARGNAARIARRTDGLSSTVKVLRSIPSAGARESRTRVLAANRGVPFEWLNALVNAGRSE